MKKTKVLAELPICRTKDVIEHFAQETARLQRMADVAFYTCNDREHSSWLCDQAYAIKGLAQKMGIWKPVYERAVEIYDFRNSGKAGYTLKDGRIVKIQNSKEEAK